MQVQLERENVPVMIASEYVTLHEMGTDEHEEEHEDEHDDEHEEEANHEEKDDHDEHEHGKYDPHT